VQNGVGYSRFRPQDDAVRFRKIDDELSFQVNALAGESRSAVAQIKSE
jgi:hypothetical protein